MEGAAPDGEQLSEPEELGSDGIAELDGADNGLNWIIDTLENGNGGAVSRLKPRG